MKSSVVKCVVITGSDVEDPSKNKLLTYIYRNNQLLWQQLQAAGIC